MNASGDIADLKALARQKRLSQIEAAKFIASLANKEFDKTSDRDDLDWASLSQLPNWCYWPASERNRLLLVAGALFSAPSIRLWIDTKRIREARKLIGDKTFELVMANNIVPKECTKVIVHKSVEQLFFCSGSAVLLSSTSEKLQTYIKPMLPEVAGKLPGEIAQLLMSEALNTLTIINQSVAEDSNAEDHSLPNSESHAV